MLERTPIDYSGALAASAPDRPPESKPAAKAPDVTHLVEPSPPKERPRPKFNPNDVAQIRGFRNPGGRRGWMTSAKDAWRFDGLATYDTQAQELVEQLAKAGRLKFLFSRKTGWPKGKPKAKKGSK